MDVLSKFKTSKAKKSLIPEQAPSKDEILNAMDTYALEKSQANKENNNNPDPLSGASSMDARWEFVDAEASSTPASLSHSYSLEWERLFTRPEMMRKLKEKAMEGDLRSSRFRSVIWKLFLEVLPLEMNNWIEKTRKTRCKFEELKNRLIVNPRKAVDSVDITLNNPLSQDEESPWNKFFQDNELRLTIKQDVIRTFPEVEFFRGSALSDMMIDILFCFSRENATHSYKQGMHELLAPIIFVLHCDHQAFMHACEMESVLEVMKEVMDPAYLEHDAYTMFCQVMETVEPWYLSRDIFASGLKSGSLRSLEIINATPFSRSQDLNPSNAIVTKLTRIQDYILKKYDPELHQHLERLEIAPQIYGIRWLRLLFGREFPMQDLLMLWDAIFGDGIGFDIVDYIFVAMLLYIRDILLTSDYATCLTVLMKYPPVADVHYFVVKAMWLREPNQHQRPPNYTHQGSIRTGSSMAGSQENVSSVNNDGGVGRATGKALHHYSQGHKRQSNMLGGFSSFSRKFSRPRTLSVPKSSSEPMNLQTDMSPGHDNNPIGSTVSLSQVEETMFRHAPSANSLARMESSNLRSAQSSPGVHHSNVFPLTPDDTSITSSPTRYNSLPGKSKAKQKKMSKVEKELQEKVAHLQGELSDKNSMCRYCSSKLDVHIGRLQQDLSKNGVNGDDEIMLSLAGLKLVRDILNGTLKFSQNITDDEEINISEDYYGNNEGTGDDYSTGLTSPESDILLGATSGAEDETKMRRQKAKLFYMSSEEYSSPDSGMVPTLSGRGKGSGSLELNEYHVQRDDPVGALRAGNLVEDERKLVTEKDSSHINTNISNPPVPFTSKIRSIFRPDVSAQQTKQPPVSSLSSCERAAGGQSLNETTHPGFGRNCPNEDSNGAVTLSHRKGSSTSETERELASIDTRRRSKSNVENQMSYWPDFLSDQGSSLFAHFDNEGSVERGVCSGNDKLRGEVKKVRERSKSQPSTSNPPLSRFGESDYGVNPLYKLRYQENMEH